MGLGLKTIYMYRLGKSGSIELQTNAILVLVFSWDLSKITKTYITANLISYCQISIICTNPPNRNRSKA